jgi:hypothetical protein
MTLPIKPSSIVHTRAQVEAMAVELETANADVDSHGLIRMEISPTRLDEVAAMLRELAGGVPVSDDEYWFMSASGEPYRVLDPRINQHRAST